MSDHRLSYTVQVGLNGTRGIAARGVQRKLYCAYFLTFVVPTTFLLLCVLQVVMPEGLPPITGLTLLIGFPSVTVLSVAGLLLIKGPLTCLRRLAAEVEARAAESEAFKGLSPRTEDEAQRVAYLMTHMMDDYQQQLTDLDRRTRDLSAVNDELRSVALVDPLTGLYNRRYALNTLEAEVQRAVKNNGSLAVLLVDPDDYDLLVEPLEHAQKTAVLKDLAHVVNGRTRRLDLVARIESERFLVILPETDLDGAVRVAERVRSSVSESALGPGNGSDGVSMTVSIGIGAFSEKIMGADKLMEMAESSLAIAKRTGKNMVWA